MATWKAVVDKTTAQTLTNKTLTSPKLNENVALAATSTELNLLDGMTAVDTDISSVSGSDDTLASAKSIKTYVDAQVTAQDLDFQGDSGGALSIDLDSETLDIAGGTNITTAGSSNTVTVNLDASPSVTNITASGSVTGTTSVKTPLIEYTDGDNAISIADGGAVTTSSDLTVTGNLTVNGTTTTINTATLTVEDKLIKLADTSSPDLDSATGAGIQVEGDATEANWSEFKWTKAKGGGNTDGTGTATGLTGWTVSNFQTSNQADYAVSIMDFKSDTGAPSGTSAGVGSLLLNTNDGELYVRTA